MFLAYIRALVEPVAIAVLMKIISPSVEGTWGGRGALCLSFVLSPPCLSILTLTALSVIFTWVFMRRGTRRCGPCTLAQSQNKNKFQEPKRSSTFVFKYLLLFNDIKLILLFLFPLGAIVGPTDVVVFCTHTESVGLQSVC